MSSSYKIALNYKGISLNFILTGVIFLGSGVALYQEVTQSPVAVFAFVASGWIISLCLHEGAHALAAYLGGDRSVVSKGYLSLDPFAYAHPLMSFGLPIVYLMLGGIGLPGGAVSIDRRAVRNRHWGALISAAGPMANLVVLLVLCLPFVFGWAYAMKNDDFWSAVAFLAALQASALVLNLLPIPGLDGFGILSPYLPEEMQEQAQAFAPLLGPLLVMLFLNKSVGLTIWNAVAALTTRLDIAPSYIFAGLSLFRFWVD